MSKGISSDLSSDDEIHRKLFIGALNPATTDDNLRKYFSKFGKLVDWIVVRCSETNRSRKFGFVTYSRLVFQNQPTPYRVTESDTIGVCLLNQ